MFDDLASGKTITDSSGNGRHGTFMGTTYDALMSGSTAPQIVAGKYGNGLLFDGADDYADMGDAAPFDFGGSVFAVTMWVKGGGDGQALFVKDDWAGTDNGIFIFVAKDTSDGNKIKYAYWNGASTKYIGEICADWCHLAIVREGTGANQLKIYLAGSLAATTTDGRIFSNAKTMRLGAPNDAGRRFSGSVDEVRIYGKALAVADVLDDKASQYPLPGTTASYSFESTPAGLDTHFRVKGVNGGALQLNGVNEYVDAGASVFRTGASAFSDFTIGAWINPKDITEKKIIVLQAPNTERQGDAAFWARNGVSNTLVIDRFTGVDDNADRGESGTGVLVANSWQRLTATW
ncbi:MAG TPA: LamG domain-containing protein, partial [archaeon]|nr:LamG domain-containing protein [archaeon]